MTLKSRAAHRALQKKPELKPLGVGPIKRTPLSVGDPAASTTGVYVVAAIKAEAVRRGKPYFLVAWEGWTRDEDGTDTVKYDTWEPVDHLPGVELTIEQFRAHAKKRAEEVTILSLTKKREEKERKRTMLAAGKSTRSQFR